MTQQLVIPAPWQELSISNDRPPARGGHCSAVIPHNNILLLFGGCDPFGVASDQLFLISLQTGLSKICKVVGKNSNSPLVPPKRSGGCLYVLSSSSLSSNKTKNTDNDDDNSKNNDNSNNNNNNNNHVSIILHGGIDYLPSCRVYGDTWIGSVDTSACTVEWKKLEKGGVSDVCRHSFASCLVDAGSSDQLFVCGGSNSEKPLASPMVLDIKKAIAMEEEETATSSSCWTPINTSSTSTSSFVPVEMCSACYLPRSKLIVIAGGRDAQGKDNDGLYVVMFDNERSQTAMMIMKKLTTSPSLQRTCASLAPLNATNSVMMIGGVSLDEQIAALPLDVAVDFTFDNNNAAAALQVKQVRPITRLECSSLSSSSSSNTNDQEIDLVGGVHFGIGQSLGYYASSEPSVVAKKDDDSDADDELVVVCVSGLFPNAMGNSSQIFVSRRMTQKKSNTK